MLLGYICNPVADDGQSKTHNISPCQSSLSQASAQQAAPGEIYAPTSSLSVPELRTGFFESFALTIPVAFFSDARLRFHEPLIGQSYLVGSQVPVKEGWESKPCYQRRHGLQSLYKPNAVSFLPLCSSVFPLQIPITACPYCRFLYLPAVFGHHRLSKII